MTGHLSCFTNSYGRFGAPSCIERVRSAGIAQVELAIKTAGVRSIFGETPVLTDQSSEADIECVRDLLERHRVGLSSCNITSGNPLDRDVLEVTHRKLRIAGRLGVPLVVAGAGEAKSSHERDRLQDHLRCIGDWSGEEGIVYCFETHPGLAQNARRMVDAMEQLEHPQLRINFDTGNVLYYNDGANVLDELRLVCRWVRHVHLKDHNGKAGDWHFPALGEGGAVDFAGVRRILEETGFDGPYSLEIEGIQGEAPLSLEEHHARVVKSVTELQRCGY